MAAARRSVSPRPVGTAGILPQPQILNFNDNDIVEILADDETGGKNDIVGGTAPTADDSGTTVHDSTADQL